MQPADSRQSVATTTKLIVGVVMTIAYLSAGFFLFMFPDKLPDKPLWVGRTLGGLLLFYSMVRGYKVLQFYKSTTNNDSENED